MLYLTLGHKSMWFEEGSKLLRHILARYSIPEDAYSIRHCYQRGSNWKVPSKSTEREPFLQESRDVLRSRLAVVPGTLVALGWMPCEVVTGKGKAKLKDMAGARWTVTETLGVGVVKDDCTWVTYDPGAALFDPPLVVDLAGAIVMAARCDGLTVRINHRLKQFNWNHATKQINK